MEKASLFAVEYGFPLAMAIISAMAILHGKNWINAGSRKQKRPGSFGLPNRYRAGSFTSPLFLLRKWCINLGIT